MYQLTLPTAATDAEEELLIASFTDSELTAMRQRAWTDASVCWQEYRSAPPGDSNGTDAEINQYRAKQALHDAAWSAEHYWRSLHDAVRQRETAR